MKNILLSIVLLSSALCNCMLRDPRIGSPVKFYNASSDGRSTEITEKGYVELYFGLDRRDSTEYKNPWEDVEEAARAGSPCKELKSMLRQSPKN